MGAMVGGRSTCRSSRTARGDFGCLRPRPHANIQTLSMQSRSGGVCPCQLLAREGGMETLSDDALGAQLLQLLVVVSHDLFQNLGAMLAQERRRFYFNRRVREHDR